MSASQPTASGDRYANDGARTIGRYRLLGLVGRGGFGEVHAAHDPELDRRVALKILTRTEDHAAVARLRLEATTMARLSHPNVARVFDVGEVDGDLFIAMEFIRGATLLTWLSGQLHTWPEIRAVFLGAGQGLAAAHREGIVHRDFKPKSECPPQTPPLPPSGRILADRGDLRGAVCRVMPRHAAVLATGWQHEQDTPSEDAAVAGPLEARGAAH